VTWYLCSAGCQAHSTCPASCRTRRAHSRPECHGPEACCRPECHGPEACCRPECHGPVPPGRTLPWNAGGLATGASRPPARNVGCSDTSKHTCACMCTCPAGAAAGSYAAHRPCQHARAHTPEHTFSQASTHTAASAPAGVHMPRRSRSRLPCSPLSARCRTR